jgi:N-acetylmuramoyl-L-alanine amidase
MSRAAKPLHRRFARVSPVFVLPLVASLVVTLFAAGVLFAGEANEAASNTTGKRQAASAQFTRAEEQRAALNAKPTNKRTLADYKQVVSTYRRVYLITPHAGEVPDAMTAVAELYVEMGDRFGRSYYQSAVDTYRFEIHEYPGGRGSQDALLRIAALERDQLGDIALSATTYEEFLKKYPRSAKRREAQEALAELALLKNNAESPSSKGAPNTGAAEQSSGQSSQRASERAAEQAQGLAQAPSEGGTDSEKSSKPAGNVGSGSPRVRRVSTSASADFTRVTIDLEDSVEYSSARIRNPDRIFFDLHTARLTPEVAKSTVHVEGSLLTAVRLGQKQAGVVRVVLDVTGVKDYTSSLLSNPPELLIDLYADTPGGRTAKVQHEKDMRDASRTPEADRERTEQGSGAASGKKDASYSPVVPGKASAANSGTTAASANAPRSAAGSSSTRSKSLKSKPDLIQPAPSAQPTRDGQSTLTRALGLKIGRIVVDAGHGGHDTGTIGPTGLMEKDLCLDVALRLGKIIQQRLPGADVVYTRSDDTFVPLEERTHIANDAKADLFISIHANSSHDHEARGIETYYLNLKGSPDAMEVAARENATAQESVHDLEDLVKKIARSEKIDESKEFASDIQESLAKRIQKSYKPVKDRGVRKAPFVVLIGADMPSILTEISFLSNPADEQLLKKPEHRQRVAEGLFQGVASYLESLNSVTMNLPRLPARTPPGRSAAFTSVEQSPNPQ